MKKLILITCILLLFFSCATSKHIQSMVSNYKGMPYCRGGQSVSLSAKQVNSTIGYFEGGIPSAGRNPVSLSIKQDGTFEMCLSDVCYGGVWVKLYKKAVLLQFNTEDLSIGSQLIYPVMYGGKGIIHFPNKNRIRVDRITLKRIR